MEKYTKGRDIVVFFRTEKEDKSKEITEGIREKIQDVNIEDEGVILMDIRNTRPAPPFEKLVTEDFDELEFEIVLNKGKGEGTYLDYLEDNKQEVADLIGDSLYKHYTESMWGEETNIIIIGNEFRIKVYSDDEYNMEKRIVSGENREMIFSSLGLEDVFVLKVSLEAGIYQLIREFDPWDYC